MAASLMRGLFCFVLFCEDTERVNCDSLVAGWSVMEPCCCTAQIQRRNVQIHSTIPFCSRTGPEENLESDWPPLMTLPEWEGIHSWLVSLMDGLLNGHSVPLDQSPCMVTYNHMVIFLLVNVTKWLQRDAQQLQRHNITTKTSKTTTKTHNKTTKWRKTTIKERQNDHKEM